MTNYSSLKELLDKKADLYNSHQFIVSDPIQIPHKFRKKEDIEIAGFLSATIAWGQRKNIIKSALSLMQSMDFAPHDYIMNSKNYDNLKFFKYRTFQPDDLLFFLESIKNIYQNHGGLEEVFKKGYFENESMFNSLILFRKVFFQNEHLRRTEKHIANVLQNASAKRINLFLRWMIRSDDRGVDFGCWKSIPTSALMLPLDLHSGNIARKLGLLKRTQNDWKAVEEITSVLRLFDKEDPVRYDFALFGMGAFEN